MPLVIVVQRYVPSYRVPLFSALSDQLEAQVVQLLVAHAVAKGSQRIRNHGASLEAWAQPVREVALSPPRGVTPTWKRKGALSLRANLMVAELGSTSLSTWNFVACRPSSTIHRGRASPTSRRRAGHRPFGCPAALAS